MTTQTAFDEQSELLEMLAEQRETLLITLRDVTEEQAASRSTVSDLTLGGVVKHLARTERVWTHVMTEQPGDPEGMFDFEQYYLTEGDTLAGLLAEYAEAIRTTDAAVASLPDLERRVPLPEAPWSPPETQYWTTRRILLHLLRETAHHSGHADIIRESLDGANTTRRLGT
ncbi:DinB family protein [Microlunatus panaciterrae]|uniref:Damage-inducible protein DinB n=1 Tax=Microlunatus panaciterrae TaxID=400768 RepID=A0ABS2RJB7_9ACTN|nr:DinB family protein [Microlunatus panaciterrae]MBM7799089.1 putative damage-inducible protein DinB [Microlunatus panaciterrae]